MADATPTGATNAATPEPVRAPRAWLDNPLWASPWTLAAGLGLLLAARIVALAFNATDLFFDEAQYWAWSEAPDWGYYSKPPLIAWIIHLATGVCGMGTACIRLPAPLLHTVTAVLVALIGRQLYDGRVGVLSGLAYATLPGVSLSSGLISTDVPLLTCWAAALASFIALVGGTARWPALALGLSLGIGLNAKYAMAWFIPLAAIYGAMVPDVGRSIVRDRRVWAALAIGLLVIAPNIAWNRAHAFATFAHTAENANWHGVPFHPDKAGDFLAGQFGVFGPVLFGGLCIIAWRAVAAWRLSRRFPAGQGVPLAAPDPGLTGPDALLAAFSLPLIAIILVQALLSRAHANWAATAYIAATVLVVAHLVRRRQAGWLQWSFGLNGAVVPLIGLATALAGTLALPVLGDPYARSLGWAALAEATHAKLAAARRQGDPFAAVLTQDRAVTAELLYYLRGDPTPVLAYVSGGSPHDHFELTRPYTAATPSPVLLVEGRPGAGAIAHRFEHADVLAVETLPAGQHATRTVTFMRLSGYKGPADPGAGERAAGSNSK